MDQTEVSLKTTELQQIWQDLVSNCGRQANKPNFPPFLQANARLLYKTGPWWLPYTSFSIHHLHHHHISVKELVHLLTRSGLTYPEVSSNVYHDSFCQLGRSVSLPWVMYFEAFYLHVVSRFSCIPVICPKFVLFLTPLQFVHLFCNLSTCILLLFSCISSLVLLFFWRPLL